MTAPEEQEPELVVPVAPDAFLKADELAESEESVETGDLVRPYVIANGRGISESNRFDPVTLVMTAESNRRRGHLSPEKRGLLALCEEGYLSVAEIAGHLRLPVGIVKVLLADLAEDGYILTRTPIPPAQLTDVQVLQEVLDGLQARFG